MNGREDKRDPHKGVFKVYFLQAEATKILSTEQIKGWKF